MANILVIDDDPFVRSSFKRLFKSLGHDVLAADSLAEGEKLAARGVDIIYLDINLPDGDGLQVIDDFAAAPGRPEVIVITGAGSRDGARRSLQSNAWDYIAKPASPQVIRDSLASALEYRNAAGSRAPAEEAPDIDRCGIVGEDASVLRVLGEIERAGASEAGVLISGETGVGKELAARAIHANSARRDKPFVIVDCSNMPDTLVESMLYGHVKGAFTGAHTDRRGLVEEADGGVLFLDEVGELSLTLQKSFLRVLQERRYRPVGGGKEMHSDFRLVAATNRDLAHMVGDGRFRSDLLFRLRTVEIELAPLRERGEDKELLARRFIAQNCDRYGFENKEASRELLKVLREYPWPGNVRELANVMEASVINAGSDPTLYPKHLPGNVRLAFIEGQSSLPDHNAPAPGKPPEGAPENDVMASQGEVLNYKEYKAVRDRVYFSELMEAAAYDITQASVISGLSAPSIYRHLSLNGLPTKPYK